MMRAVLGLAALAGVAWFGSTTNRLGLSWSTPPAKPSDAWTRTRELTDALRGWRWTSGVRTEAENAAAGGVPSSQHLTGEARDGVPTDGRPAARALLDVVDRGFPLDQGIAYATSRGGHVHLSTKAAGNRGELLAAPRGGGYLAGRSYVEALAENPDATADQLRALVA